MKFLKIYWCFIFLFWGTMGWAQDKTYRTPRAGEAYTTNLFGEKINVASRDRSLFRAFNVGTLLSVPKIVTPNPFPFLAFFYKKIWKEENMRLRAVAVGVFDQIDFEKGREFRWLFSFYNLTPPVATTEVFRGRDREETEVFQGYLRGALGLGWARPLSPGHIDNELTVALFYEPGFWYFGHTENTSPNLILPPNVYEHRLHLRVRADGFERNLVELRHRGWNLGLDAVLGRREGWKTHGFLGQMSRKKTEEYFFCTAFGSATFGIPGLSERHRLTTSIYGGYSLGTLDRYSAMPLGGGPTGDESESLSIPILGGTMIGEFLTEKYFLATLEYRLEVFFFFYLHLRATGGWMKYRDFKGSKIAMRRGPIGVLSGAITTGFLLNSLLNLEYSFNWTAKRDGRRGRHVFLLSWSFEL